jgi:ribonuclease BN (tRNA processing enzyme)
VGIQAFRPSHLGTGCGSAHNPFRISRVCLPLILPVPHPQANSADTTSTSLADEFLIDCIPLGSNTSARMRLHGSRFAGLAVTHVPFYLSFPPGASFLGWNV